VDGLTENMKALNPLDKFSLQSALKLRYVNGLTLDQIANKFKVSKQAVSEKINKYIGILPNPEEIKAFKSLKGILLTGVEQVLVQQILDPEKLSKASLNNAAYAFSQIDQALRLELGQSTQNIDTHVDITVSSVASLRRQKIGKNSAIDEV
jgi:predicted DNA-binding protein YlxM (UPF0122 family)